MAVETRGFIKCAVQLFTPNRNSVSLSQRLLVLAPCCGTAYRSFNRQCSNFRTLYASPMTNLHVFYPGISICLSRTSHLRNITTQSLSDKFTLKNDTFRKYLNHLALEYDMLSNRMGGQEFKMEGKHVHLITVGKKIKALQDKTMEVRETQDLIDGLPSDETEMRLLATQELAQCQEEITLLEREVVELLTPNMSGDHNDVILEVSAGVGGQEAMLFSAQIFQMYQNFALYKGGLRRASASISGPFVYKLLKYEAGVHRVQRVPKTEKAGRVHTSTTAVAVLPQPTEIDVTLNAKDLQIETCRASGKGGQHVNTTDSAVRIVHLPTGIVAECQQERSQIKNKEIAMKVLKSRIYQKFLDEQISQQQQSRKFQVGTAGRSEKIRTYNFSQDRITDHRLSQNMFNMERFISGQEQLDRLLHELLRESRLEILEETLSDFQANDKNVK